MYKSDFPIFQKLLRLEIAILSLQAVIKTKQMRIQICTDTDGAVENGELLVSQPSIRAMARIKLKKALAEKKALFSKFQKDRHQDLQKTISGDFIVKNFRKIPV